MPQVHGAVRDTLTHCREVMEIEVNSAVDNPLVFLKAREEMDSLVRPAERGFRAVEADVISGGNFHGQPMAFVLDFLGIALSALAGISERRLERMVNPALSEGLPPFLAPGAGLNSGFMMPQVSGGVTGQRKQSAGASRVGRFDYDFRKQGRLRFHGDDRCSEAEKDCREYAQCDGD